MRDKGYRIRLSSREFKLLSELSESSGMTKSEYIRYKVFGKIVEDNEDEGEIIYAQSIGREGQY